MLRKPGALANSTALGQLPKLKSLFKSNYSDNPREFPEITHNNKMSSVTNALERVSGSIDFTAFIRSGISISKNPQDED